MFLMVRQLSQAKNSQTTFLIQRLKVNKMNAQEQFKQMKAEDKAYGERQQKKSQQVKVKQKNQLNYARMSLEDVMRMEEEELDEVELQY
jgi:hypothetical protein